MAKKVLIISYTFPPFPGIGGRRWVKFAKYLSKTGNHINVIACQNAFKVKSEWEKDAKEIMVQFLPLKYPKALITFPQHIWGKFLYKLGRFWVMLRTGGNYYDKTLFWKAKILQCASKCIIQNNIKNVIVTGAPFHLMHHVSELKTLFPQIKLVLDFRDFWTDDKSLGSLISLSEKRINKEKIMEHETLQKADCVFTVSDYMTQIIQKRCDTKKCFTLLNGFDPEDYSDIEEIPKTSGIINFIFTGNLYNNIENIFTPFCMALKKLKEEKRDIYSILRFHFYGSSSRESRVLVSSLNLEIITFSETIPLKKTLSLIKQSDYCMLFLNNTYSFSLSTKFCEYLGLNKSIVLFAEEGYASDYIKRNNLGCWINPKNSYSDILKLVENHKTLNGKVGPISEELRNIYSLPVISKTLESFLI